jgi:hypothetical protein
MIKLRVRENRANSRGDGDGSSTLNSQAAYGNWGRATQCH